MSIEIGSRWWNLQTRQWFVYTLDGLVPMRPQPPAPTDAEAETMVADAGSRFIRDALGVDVRRKARDIDKYGEAKPLGELPKWGGKPS